VTCIPFFDGAHDSPTERQRVWFYKVLIEYTGDYEVQLLARFWRTHDNNSNEKYFAGRGAAGRFPYLAANNKAFQYTSMIGLNSASALMGGSFTFVEIMPYANRSQPFVVHIPTFELRSRNLLNVPG